VFVVELNLFHFETATPLGLVPQTILERAARVLFTNEELYRFWIVKLGEHVQIYRVTVLRGELPAPRWREIWSPSGSPHSLLGRAAVSQANGSGSVKDTRARARPSEPLSGLGTSPPPALSCPLTRKTQPSPAGERQ